MNLKVVLKQVGWPVTLGVLGLLALAAGFLAANNLALVTFAFGGALLCLLIVYTCLFHPVNGYYLTTLVAFFAFYPSRIINRDLPLTTFTEVLVLFLFIGSYWLIDQKENRKANLLKSGVTILLIINILYFAIQVFNPNAGSTSGWLFASKRYTVYILFFFISYKIINTPARFRFFLKFWVVMAFIAAVYACIQQWIGFTPWETRYLMDDPHEYALLFQNGVVRKFSFLDGVVTFGSLAGSFSVLTLILAVHEKNKKRRNQLFFAAFILYLGMSYSGTRTFTVMLPAGVALYVLMTLKNKATLLVLFSTILAVVFILFAPIDSPTLNRMRSTVDSNDESLNVRTVNRHRIQPYIYTHPFGGGVGSSGVEGMRFNSRHPLAGFPPDSGLLKLALDMGWIGLAITMLFYLMILYQGIVYYFTIRNPEYRKYLVAITCALFSIFVTLYSQVSIGQIPNTFFFYAVIALFTRFKEWDQKERALLTVAD